jgi:hypothetical protein
MAMLNSASVNQTVASVRNGALLGSARYQPAPSVRGSRATSPGSNEPRKTSPASHGFGRREGLVRVGAHATKYARRAPRLGQARGTDMGHGRAGRHFRTSATRPAPASCSP